MNLSITVWEGVSYFLPSTSFQRPQYNAAAVHIQIVTPRVMLVRLWHHFHCAQLALETYWYRPEMFLLLLTGYRSLGVQFILGLTFQLTQFPQDRTQQKFVSHDKMNSPLYHKTALRPNVFFIGIHWLPVIISNGLISNCTIIIKV